MPTFLPLVDAPVAQRRVGRDAGAEQRRGAGEVEVGRDAQDEVLVHDDAVGVAAVGDRRRLVLVRRVVGERHVRAELLEPGLAVGAGAVGIDQAADAGEVAGLEFGDGRSHLGDPADDLVARHARVNGRHDVVPLVAGLVKVGVADAAEENFDLHVAVGRIASRDRGGGQRRCRTGGGVGFNLIHNCVPVVRLNHSGETAT